jgi:hypothetical protein
MEFNRGFSRVAELVSTSDAVILLLNNNPCMGAGAGAPRAAGRLPPMVVDRLSGSEERFTPTARQKTVII